MDLPQFRSLVSAEQYGNVTTLVVILSTDHLDSSQRMQVATGPVYLLPDLPSHISSLLKLQSSALIQKDCLGNTAVC